MARPIISLAKKNGAWGIAPGYGFLSESVHFAKAVERAGLVWVGPPSDQLALFGEKVSARQLARRCGVPILPGTQGEEASLADVEAFARSVGHETRSSSRPFPEEVVGACRLLISQQWESRASEARINLVRERHRRPLATAEYMRKGTSSRQGTSRCKLSVMDQAMLRTCGNESAGSSLRTSSLSSLSTLTPLSIASLQRRHQKLVEIAPSLL
ncbi:hypothetical protein L7F22_069021 [Adiantum nelumboides]|nr:hypothetical protein [Adiantum nelumboides]